MRTSIYFLAAAFLATTLLFVASCSKEEVSERKQTNVNDPSAVKAFNRIQQFKSKIAAYKENPQLKSGELIEIDSMLWDFNAVLNFDYSKVDDPYKNFYSETVYPEISIGQDNMVSFDDAASVYMLLEDAIQNSLNSAPYDDKDVQFTYVRVENIENQTLTLKSTTSVGESGSRGTVPFRDVDDWMYGDDLGDCYGNYITERDGADEIRDMVESRRHIFIPVNPSFYVNPVTVILDKSDIDNNSLLDLTGGQGYDNNRDFRIFYAHEDHCEPGYSLSDFECIENDDMNFYLFQMEDLVYDIIPFEPNYWPDAEGLTFIRFDTILGTILLDDDEKSYLIHEPVIIFAQKKTYEE